MLSSLQRPNKMVEKKFEHLPSPWRGSRTRSPLRACGKRARHSRTAGKNLESWTWTHSTWLEPGPTHHLHTPWGAERPHPTTGYKVQLFLKEAQPPPDPALNNHHISHLAQMASVKPLGLCGPQSRGD